MVGNVANNNAGIAASVGSRHNGVVAVLMTDGLEHAVKSTISPPTW